MAKGSDFERSVAKRLGMWWGGRDDIFWRSHNSGGRATARLAAGATTAGQYGDIAATDPVGVPLIGLITWELKKGYSNATQTIHNHLDRNLTHGATQFELFVHQAKAAADNAPSMTWALVWQRTGRRAWVWMPDDFVKDMRKYDCWRGVPAQRMYVADCFKGPEKQTWTGSVFGCPLDEWLRLVDPTGLQRMAEVYL